MFNFIVNADGGLTTAGYILCAAFIVAVILIAALLAEKKEGKRVSTRQLVYCSAAIALAYVTSYFKLVNLPFGGSVTLFSMLFICMIGYWYGPKIGILAGLAYGMLQFLQEPYVLSLFQVLCDYIFAFAALGLAGCFYKSQNGLVKGYIVGVLVRGVFHSLGGYLYWMDYMPENFPKAFAGIYPIVYNYSFLIAEAILTLLILMLPPMKKAMIQLKKSAAE